MQERIGEIQCQLNVKQQYRMAEFVRKFTDNLLNEWINNKVKHYESKI